MRTNQPKPRFFRAVLSWFDSNDLAWMPPCSAIGANAREREVNTLRRHARRLIRHDRVAKYGSVRVFVQTAAWPLIATIKTAIDLRHRAIPFGSPFWAREFTRIWRLQIFHNLRIADQAEYCLDTPERLRLCRSFLSCREQQILLERAVEVRRDRPRLDEKRVFARFCDEHNFPHPPTLMTGEGAEVVCVRALPAADLLLKPTDLCQGQGVEILAYDAQNLVWHAPDGTALSTETLPAYATTRLQDHPWILQPRLINPESWKLLTPGPLSTVRVVTGITSPGGKPAVVGIQARFSIRHPFVDNISAGGMSSSVDPETGRMRIGLTWAGGPRENTVHPITGGQVEGVVLPEWTQLRDLALRAHVAAGDWPSIGWDVASTTVGPMLIEANLLWGAMSFVPQGHMPFIETLQTAFGPDYAGLYAPPPPKATATSS